MEKTVGIDDGGNFYRPIKRIGPGKPGLSEVIQESDCSLIQPQVHRLEPWEKHFRHEFGWLTATVDLQLWSASVTM